MTIRECIDRLDGLKPNQYQEETKIRWLSILDSEITTNIIYTHHLLPGEEYKDFEPYTTQDLDKPLIAPFPHDEMYIAYLEMKIDEANKETARYNNSAILFNAYYDNFAKAYQKIHKPINKARFNNWR